MAQSLRLNSLRNRLEASNHPNDAFAEPPKTSPGHVQKSSAICDTLQECLNLSARLRGDLFGEAEQASDQTPRMGHVSGMLHDALEMAAQLRNELEQINEGINPMKAMQVAKGGR
jgi:hypothetical protein